jgi:hypothetical protein
MDDDGSAEVVHEGILHKLDGRLQQQTNVFIILNSIIRPAEMRIHVSSANPVSVI